MLGRVSTAVVSTPIVSVALCAPPIWRLTYLQELLRILHLLDLSELTTLTALTRLILTHLFHGAKVNPTPTTLTTLTHFILTHRFHGAPHLAHSATHLRTATHTTLSRLIVPLHTFFTEPPIWLTRLLTLSRKLGPSGTSGLVPA